jgi:GT2 family glycosyltransferase
VTQLLASVVVGADPDLIHDCVRSLITSAGKYTVEVHIAVNHPYPSLLSELQRLSARSPGVHVHVNSFPLGFAANHNRMLKDRTADYLLVANDDLIFQDRAVESALDELERPGNTNVAALSPRLRNGDGTLQRSTYGFPTIPRALLDLSGLRGAIPHNALTDFLARRFRRDKGRSRFWAHDRAVDVETFRGAAMFVRGSVWNDVGEFCEITRVGGEIAEWHRRCHDRGWRIRFFPGSEVTHFGSRTVGRDRLLQSEYLKGYLIYFARHGNPGASALFRGAGIVICCIRLAIATFSGDRTAIQLWRTNISILSTLAWLKG